MNKTEMAKLEAYMRRSSATTPSASARRSRRTTSAEVYIKDEFVGVLYRDEDEGELSWNFTMAILEMDVEGA